MLLDHHILDNAPFAVYAVNGERKVLYVNRTLRTALSLHGKDPVGQKCGDVLALFECCQKPAKCPVHGSLTRHDELRAIPVSVKFPGAEPGKHLLWTSWQDGDGGPYLLVWLVSQSNADNAGGDREREPMIPEGGETARRLAELTAVNRITSGIARAQDLQDVLKLTLREVINVLGGNKGAIYLRDGGQFVIKEKYGVSDHFIRQPKIFSRDVEEWGFKPVICDSASAKSRNEGIYSWISVPLMSGSRAAGLIIVTGNRERHFSLSHLQFLNTIANDVGMAVANAELLEKVRQLSVHDPLTGLFNRLKFDEKLRDLSASAEPVSVCVIDLDGLKLVNDTLGHARGDDMIGAAAAVISGACRPGDFAARIGGDEFALILPGADALAAEQVCQAILQSVEAFNQSGAPLRLSVSVGAASSRPVLTSLLDTVKAADAAMYRNKLAKTMDKRCSLLSVLNTAMAERGQLSNEHAYKLSRLARSFGDIAGLPLNQGRDLELLAVAHDVGKVGVPDSVLLKPGPLSAEERSLMEKHCEIGHRIAKSAAELDGIAHYILHHHERWDGQGYPQGLKGEEIPLVCRLLAIIDSYDAMTSDRPYRKAMPHEEAVAELGRCAGSQFDPDLVQMFLRLVAPGLDEAYRTQA